MNQLAQRLVAAEQVEGDEGRGLTAGQVVPVNWRLGRPGDQSPSASSAILDGMSDFRRPLHSAFILDRRVGSQHTAAAWAPPGQPISRRGPLSLHAAATFLSSGHRGLKTSAIWLIFVAAHAEKLVGLLGGAVLTEHLNAMGAGRS